MPKLQTETVVRCSADSFYYHLKSNMNNVPQYLPETFKSIQVVEGYGMNMGTVRHWKYAIGDNIFTGKDMVEHLDDENRSITYKVIEGDMKNLYDSFRFKLLVTPLGEDECSVQWTVDYVKAHEHVPTPNAYLDMASMITREMARQLKY